MKLVYIAGPYRARSGYQIAINIHNAWRLGIEVAELGAFPVVPHANTAHMDGAASDQFWLDGTMELLRRCDAVMFTHDWERSTGARGERDEAMRLGLPCFDELESLSDWLESR